MLEVQTAKQPIIGAGLLASNNDDAVRSIFVVGWSGTGIGRGLDSVIGASFYCTNRPINTKLDEVLDAFGPGSQLTKIGSPRPPYLSRSLFFVNSY